MPLTPLNFPDHFTWGVATAAPQIEGAIAADGKGPSIWDFFARKPGAIEGGDSLEPACEHYHRYREDCKLMADLGVKNYRLSIAWPRIMPEGSGHVNAKGVDFYHRLFDALQNNGITPWVTMFHWDLPQALEDKGGWGWRGTSDAFADYANEIARAYGDRVKNWITLNETQVFIEVGYKEGRHAPGRKESDQFITDAFHHALLCHGHGVRAIRQHAQKGARVGLTDNTHVSIPLTETAEDIAAARSNFALANARVLGAISTGEYGEVYRQKTGGLMPAVQPGDLALISQPTDFLGMNTYSGDLVDAGPDGKPRPLPYPPHYPTADSPWLKLNPRALYWGGYFAHDVYGVKEIYITENGAGYNDAPPVNHEVLDLHRLEYVRACVKELRRGIGDGIPVRGYFLWSVMDNFEWADGYARRFGIVYNDFKTQERTPKASALWYKKVMKANAVV